MRKPSALAARASAGRPAGERFVRRPGASGRNGQNGMQPVPYSARTWVKACLIERSNRGVFRQGNGAPRAEFAEDPGRAGGVLGVVVGAADVAGFARADGVGEAQAAGAWVEGGETIFAGAPRLA